MSGNETPPLGHARGTFIDSDSKTLREFVPNFPAAIGVIPPTDIVHPFSDIPQSGFFSSHSYTLMGAVLPAVSRQYECGINLSGSIDKSNLCAII